MIDQKTAEVAEPTRAEGKPVASPVLTVLVVVAVLYFAREVLIPLTLAILLAFLLGPLVVRLRRWGLGRIPSALLVVVLSFTVLGILGGVLATQLADLTRRLPGYQQNVDTKLQAIRSSGGWLVERISAPIQSVTQLLAPPPTSVAPKRIGEERPLPVEIRGAPVDPLALLQKALGSLLGILLTGAIVVVFVIFMLSEREDLRDRIFRLTGARRVHMTTNLLDDAARRVSRYLLAQLVVNAAFGALAAAGLKILGIPNPLLWGILAALLRYLPYLGIWIAAILPAMVAFAVKPGWMDLPLILALYFAIDVLMYNLVEPLLYGSSTGISPLAILVAAVFWTWLWGPVGLLLTTPLTVCVVVIGRHVPNLGFLSILLSDEEVLSPQTRLYQRLMAFDLDEATEIAEEFQDGKSLTEFYDGLIVPVLRFSEADRHRARLQRDRFDLVLQGARLLVEVAAEALESVPAQSLEELRRERASRKTEAKEADLGMSAACIPAKDEADQLGAEMLTELLRRKNVAARCLSSTSLTGEQLEDVARHKPPVACVIAIPPLGHVHARYACRRLKAEFPGMKVIAVILADCDLAQLRQRKPPLMADEIACTLQDGVNQTLTFLSLDQNPIDQKTEAVG